MTETLDRLTAALADRYRIERELGQGGMATVYLAHDLRHDRKVAIKVLRSELAAVIGAERFLAEIRTTANLQHPHILPLHDSGAADAFLYYVMPYVVGESLRDRLNREKQLPIADVIRMVSEVGGALDYAHRQGVIHRDIKPENILLHDGSALVADFGIALAASKAGAARMTETGMSIGTPQYMSPEQAMGEREITARSDVYSLGAVAYEGLIGEPPFSGPTAQSIVAQVLTEEPRPLIPRRHTIPVAVEQAVMTALEKLPADRFETARAFAAALGDPSFRRSTQGTRVLTSAQPGPLPLRPVMVALIALLGLIIGAAGAAILVGRGVPDLATTRILLRFPAGQEWRAIVYGSVAVPPDGSGLLYVGPGVNTRTQLWIRHWNETQGVRLTQTVDEGCCATFSPSGDTIAYFSAPRQINILPLNGGLPATLPDSGLQSVTDWGSTLDWAGDGWLYASGMDGLIRIDPRNGAKQLVARHDTARGDVSFQSPQVLPGGKGAVVTLVRGQSPADPERASIGIADFSTKRVEVIEQGVRAIYAPPGYLIVAKANGVLWAVPFDIRRLRPTGTGRALADTVAVRGGSAGPGAVDLALDRRGTLIYVSGGEASYQAAWVERSGSWRPIGEGVHGELMDSPVLSPDGGRLALAIAGDDRNLHLWVVPLDGGPRVRLTFEGAINMRAAWRPGTNTITFVSDRGTRRRAGWNLYQRNAGGLGDIQALRFGDPRGIGGHTWSPDGRWLVLRTDDQEPGNGDILAFRPGIDTVARSVVATSAEEMGPAVSPDGRWLAYSSNETGRREVYVRRFPVSGEARYQISTTGGISPLWNPNGRELFFIDGAQNMVSVSVSLGAAFRAVSSRILFSAADYFNAANQAQFAVSPDGQRFVMLRREAGTNPGVVVVFNFLEELKRRMAAQ